MLSGNADLFAWETQDCRELLNLGYIFRGIRVISSDSIRDYWRGNCDGGFMRRECTGGFMAEERTDFPSLIVKYDRAILRYILMLTSQWEDAEEVLQRTSVALWEKFPEYDPTCDFMPWACRFAYIEVLSYRKEEARHRRIFREEVLSVLRNSLETQQESLEMELESQRQALDICLRDLQAKDRLLLQHRYSNASSIKSLAEESGRTPKSLYRRLDRLRDLISACVEKRLFAIKMT